MNSGEKNKNMIENTKDIFYIVLSFCIFWLTVFLCWGLYYLAQTFRQTNEIISSMRERVAHLTDIVDLIKSKALGFVTKKAFGFMTGAGKEAKNKKKK